MNLKTQDIDGCKIGSVRKINQFTGKDYNLEVKDIPGAIASSRKRGMTTERNVNPIWPQYKVPGHSELTNKYNNPYGKSAFDEKNKRDKKAEEDKDNQVSKTTTNFYPK